MATQTILGLVLKLVQINIWQGKLLKEVIAFLKAQDADVVCLQEVFSSQSFIAPLDIANSLEQIIEQLPVYTEVFFEPCYSFEASGTKILFGNAIISKQPLRNRKSLFTHGHFVELTDWSQYIKNSRTALLTTVSIGDKDFTLINHHGYHEMTPVGSEDTVTAMSNLIDVLRQIDGPLVLAGDLNVTIESKAMRLFDGWLKSLTAEYSVTDTLSKFGKVSGVACDHILVSDDVKVTNFEVSEELISDHKALILDFTL